MGFRTMSGIPKVTSTASFYSNTNPMLQSRGLGGYAEPSALFGNGEQGAWWDFSDLTSMFQDSAGTVAAALESTVGKVLDKSGRGNHLIQATAGARPKLSKRFNYLSSSADITNNSWTIRANQQAVDANTLWNVADGSVTEGCWQQGTGAGNQDYTLTAVLSAGTVGVAKLAIKNNATDTVVASKVVNLTPNKQTFQVNGVTNGATPGYRVEITTNGNFGTIGIWGADIRLTADAALAIPQLQRTGTTATDYDTVGFPAYLAFDGATKWMQSVGAINFLGTDKVTVIAGTTKLSDATIGAIIELSGDWGLNNGTFAMFGPRAAGGAGAQLSWISGGTVKIAQDVVGFPAPTTTVLSGQGDIGGALSTEQVNNSQVAQSSASEGAGNYGNYPLNIGARNSGASAWFNGRMFGIIVRGAPTNANDLSMCNRWMGSKCGLFF